MMTKMTAILIVFAALSLRDTSAQAEEAVPTSLLRYSSRGVAACPAGSVPLTEDECKATFEGDDVATPMGVTAWYAEEEANDGVWHVNHEMPNCRINGVDLNGEGHLKNGKVNFNTWQGATPDPNEYMVCKEQNSTPSPTLHPTQSSSSTTAHSAIGTVAVQPTTAPANEPLTSQSDITANHCAAHQWFDANMKICASCPDGTKPSDDKSACTDEVSGGLTELQLIFIGTAVVVGTAMASAAACFYRAFYGRKIGGGGDVESQRQ